MIHYYFDKQKRYAAFIARTPQSFELFGETCKALLLPESPILSWKQMPDSASYIRDTGHAFNFSNTPTVEELCYKAYLEKNSDRVCIAVHLSYDLTKSDFEVLVENTILDMQNRSSLLIIESSKEQIPNILLPALRKVSGLS